MRIYGASDDLIEVESHNRADEYNSDRLRFTIGDNAGGVVRTRVGISQDQFMAILRGPPPSAAGGARGVG